VKREFASVQEKNLVEAEKICIGEVNIFVDAETIFLG
jgi:hypothetical protein